MRTEPGLATSKGQCAASHAHIPTALGAPHRAMTMTRAPRHPRRAVLAALALTMTGTGCQFAIASTSTTGAGAPMIAEPVGIDLVQDLGLDDVGHGTMSWWATDSEVARPAWEVTPIGPFVPVDLVRITDVVAANVTPLPTALAEPQVVLRPAWSTTVDTHASSTPMRLAVAEEVTISFSTPGAPGQFPDDDSREVLEVTTDVTVGGESCEHIVALQVWQVGPPDVEAFDGAVQADYLGWLLVRAACD